MDANLIAAYQQPAFVKATLVRFDMAGGAICLTDGGFVIFDAGEGDGPEAYTGHHPVYGSLDTVGSIKDGSEAQTTRIDIGILPVSDVAAAALAAPSTQGTRVQWWEGAVDRASGLLIGAPELKFDGEIDKPRFQVGDSWLLTLECGTQAERQLEPNADINRNLLPGGSGERGVVGWDAPAGLTVVDSPANGGSVFYKDYTGAGVVDHLHISPKVAIGEATHITLSFKGGSLGFSGGVRLGYLGFYNDAGNYIGESATRPLTGGEVTAAKPSGATKVAFVAKVSGTASSSYAEVFFRQIKIEPGQVATIYSNDALDQYLSSSVGELRQATIDLAAGKADASRVTTLEASVNTPGTGISARLTNVESVAASADGRAKAIKGVVLDVNGYVSGYSSTNDGTSAAFEVSADKFGIRAPGSGERTEYRAGNWYVYSPSENTRTRYGKAFGGDQKLVWWTGPTSVAEGSETKGNAYVYMSQNTVGGPRFGGSDVIGPGGTLTATASTGFIGGARNGAGYVNTSNQVTVTVSGGTSGATIRWTRISGDSRIQMNNATAFTTGAYATIGAGEVISAYFMGAITKGGQSAVVYVQVDLSDNGT